jgi:hypothetical protein
MGILYPFQPARGKGATFAPNAGSVDISSALVKGCRQYCVTNLAATVIYVRVGDGAAATAADQPVEPNQQRIFTKDGDDVTGAAFCAGVGSVHIISGTGN